MFIQDYLNKKVSVIIDRQMGSRHPKHGFIYPVNYGYIDGTISADGEELDAYIVGVHEALEKYEGTVIAIIERTDDDDPKLIVCPTGKDYSDDAIRALTEFQEKFFTSTIVR